MDGQQLPRRWFWATATGWWLGIPLVVLLALASDAMGIEGGQAIVGLAMGAGVGWRQRGLLQGWLPAWRRWAWVSTLGFGLPFVLADMTAALGVTGAYSLPLAAVLGGLVVGAWQARLLRSWLGASKGWILPCLAGWALGATAGVGADRLVRALGLIGPAGALLYLALAACGGPLLGLATGLWLRGRLAAVASGGWGHADVCLRGSGRVDSGGWD